jgi:hypothetical protein
MSVPVGTYFVWYLPCGRFTELRESVQLHDGAYSYDAATPVNVAAGSSQTLVRSVGPPPGASVSGVVTDSDGRPVANCAVLVITRTPIPTIVAAGETDANGAYAAHNSPPGSMDVLSHCGRGFVSTYHGFAVDPAQAEPITTTAGQTTAGVDITMIRNAQSVAGTVSWEGSPGTACAYAVAEDGTLLGTASVDPDGTWEIVALPVGTVRIGFFGCAGPPSNGPVPEWYEDAADWADATLVPVSASGATTQIDATLSALGGLSFAFFAEGGGNMLGVCTWITDPTGTQLVQTRYSNEGGFTLFNVAPGEYRALFTDCGGGFPAEWYENAPDHATSTPIIVAPGEFTSVYPTLG